MSFAETANQIETLLARAEEELRILRARASMLASANVPNFREEDFKAFLKEPYVLVPKAGHQWYCLVPRFVDFNVGWLERTTASYNVFLINRYTLWLGDVPEEIRDQTGLTSPPGDLSVVDGKLLFGRGEKPIAEQYKEFISAFSGNAGRVKRGREFDLLAALVSDGYLPFVPQPVAAADRRDPSLAYNLSGKYQYQADAYHEFMRRGALGVFWMTSAGKSFLAMAALDSLKGRKLIVVPTRTLVDQWKEYFNKYCQRLYNELTYYNGYAGSRVEIITYNAYEKVRQNDYVFTLFDECHRLPANSFSRLSTIRTKYRMGLSASPYREDGRTNFIIALTGYPTGMDWRSMMEVLGKEFHTIDVHIVATPASKLIRVSDLFRPGVKTAIFSDSIDVGASVARRLQIPHIHGGTSNRLKVAQTSKAFVASRVFDEGVSLPDLEHIIEVDFLGGSRRQEIQRTGRLMHSQVGESHHDIIMTRDEFDRFKGRLHSLTEKGFKVNVHA